MTTIKISTDKTETCYLLPAIAMTNNVKCEKPSFELYLVWFTGVLIINVGWTRKESASTIFNIADDEKIE